MSPADQDTREREPRNRHAEDDNSDQSQDNGGDEKQDKKPRSLTPFIIGTLSELTDFTLQEATSLAE